MFRKISSMFQKVWTATKTKQNKQSEMKKSGQEPQKLTDESLDAIKGGIMKTKHDTVKN